MDLTGKITGIAVNLDARSPVITFEANEDIRPIISELQNLKAYEKLTISLKRWRKKRSLDANAYYWVLVSRIAEKLRSSKEEIHNLMLARYGQPEMDENGSPVILSVLDRIDLSKRDDIHVKAVGTGSVGGKRFTHYLLLRGSHTYNTHEMSVLIDGVVSEAREMGIETLPPEELANMMAAWNGGRQEGR